MKVSVIVPVYNTAKYLKQCLWSLKNQTLVDIEVICVNDGSTDDSRDIIEEFVGSDQRFKAIHKSNTGYGASMNMGIRAAQSPYIGIVESDDFAEQNMFQSLYEEAWKHQADLVKGNYNTYCDAFSHPVFQEMLKEYPYGQVISSKINPEIFGVHPSVWASLYRRRFLEENNIWFSETPGASYQDIAFAFKVNASAKRICLIKDGVLNYRVDNVESSVHNPKKIFCVCNELEEIERYIGQRKEAGALGGERAKELYQLAAWVKFRNYLWNYTRLSLPYQYAFLMKVLEELRKIRRQGCESQVWNQWEIETLEQMADAPDEFFGRTGKGYEDSRISMIPVLNHSFSVICFRQMAARFREIYLYGAGQIGQGVWSCLKKMGVSHKVKGFIVSEPGHDFEQIEDKPVVVFSELQNQDNRKALVMVAMHGRFHYEIALKLQDAGFQNILLIDEMIKSWIFD